MPTVQSVLDALETIAPARTAFSFDKVGLQIGEPGDPVSVGIVSLDASEGLIEFARESGAQIVVCHHPLFWDSLTKINSSSRAGRLAVSLIQNRIAIIGAHTNWDCAPGGINDTLAAKLGLEEVEACGEAAEVAYLKLTTFVPANAADAVVESLARAGAGIIGQYERCAFLSHGTGTFRGRPGTHPSVGEAGRVEQVNEIRLEMRLLATLAGPIIAALRQAHPYEEPAYDLYSLKASPDQPISRVGVLPRPMSLREFSAKVDRDLDTRCWVFGDPERKVSKVTVCGGAADGEWATAKQNGSDVFLTGEVRHHIAIEASEAGIGILAAGHYATEHPGAVALADALGSRIAGTRWLAHEPKSGATGRPSA